MMKHFLLIAALLAGCKAEAQTSACLLNPDRWRIEDAGIGRAIVTYYNSGEGCSEALDAILTSRNGISVRIIVASNADQEGKREQVVIIPQDLGMTADPPEAWLSDGAEETFEVSGGMS